jgi:uncharacterized protein YdhG (YjbR/CyaY superfamily)
MKTDTTAPRTIDEYIAGFPPDVQDILQQIRRTIQEAAPEAEEAISYQMPTFRLHGNLVHFAATYRLLSCAERDRAVQARVVGL